MQVLTTVGHVLCNISHRYSYTTTQQYLGLNINHTSHVYRLCTQIMYTAIIHCVVLINAVCMQTFCQLVTDL